MALSDYKISGSEINTNGVVSAPDILTGTTQENKAIFDKLPTLITNKFNALIDSLSASGAAEIGSQPFDEVTAKNIQDALKQIRDLIGSYYIGEDGAGKVGYTPSEGVDEDTVQEAIEAVQANLAAYIAKIKAATGAAEVGNAPIAGMRATNVQHALEELRKNIDNIVSGIIPGGSITSDMLQDGAVTADKLGSDVTGEEIPTSASDSTSISSQLSNRAAIADTTALGFGPTPAFAPAGSCKNLGQGKYIAFTSVEDLPYESVWLLDVTIHPDLPYKIVKAVDISSSKSGDEWKLLEKNGVWGEWVEFVTATPPQEYDLPLAEGITALQPCTYYKNQFSEVTLGGCISGSVSDGATIATLPEGFRPDHPIERPAAFTASGNRYAGSVFIAANGIVSIHTPAEATNVVFAASFLAKN